MKEISGKKGHWTVIYTSFLNPLSYSMAFKSWDFRRVNVVFIIGAEQKFIIDCHIPEEISIIWSMIQYGKGRGEAVLFFYEKPLRRVGYGGDLKSWCAQHVI